MKKILCVLMAALMVGFLFAGCGTTETPATNDDQSAGTTEPADPSAEGTKAILVVSFGTSYNDSRDLTIGGIENAITAAFPDYEVRRAFTAQTIIDILKDREGITIDNVAEAMDKLVADGVSTLIIQPTHLMNGYEYDDIVEDVNKYADKFDSLVIGEPLLTSDDDFTKVIDVITAETASYSNEETAVVFMGHGTEHEANAVYPKMQEMLTAAGYNNYFIGTVEATPTLEDVLKAVQDGGYKKVVLEALMVVAGDHANNDMAGDEEDSWKSAFEKAGFETECILKGLGQFEGIQAIYVEHVQAAIDSLAK